MKRDNVSLRPLHTTLGDISDEVVDKRGPRHGEWFTYVDISSIDRHNKRIVDPKLLRVAEAPSRAKQFIKEGDVLISMTRPNLNAVAKVPRELDGAVCSTGFHVLRSKSAHPGYLYYLVQTPQFINAMETVVQGALYPAVRPKDISSFPILLPSSFDDQQLLVAHLDLQLSRLDAAVAALKRAQANLKRYRASVLQAAVTGRLVPTEHDLAEAEGRDYETGEQLLERILTERRRTWCGKGKYSEPLPVLVGESRATDQELPSGWSLASVGQLIREKLTNGVSVKGSLVPPGVRALRLNALRDNGLDYDMVRFLPLEESDVADILIESGDFLISRGNGSLHLVARGTVAQAPPEPTIFPDTMIRLRLNKAIADSAWLYILWPSRPIRDQISAKVKTTAGIYKISQPQVEQILIPLPPLAEQARIVEEVERRLSVADRLEATLEANLRRATRLRQAILKKAFTFEDGNEEAGAQKEEG